MLAMLCRDARMPRAQATAWMPEVEQCREQLPDAQERPPSPHRHSNVMDAPAFYGISCARVEVLIDNLNQQERPR